MRVISYGELNNRLFSPLSHDSGNPSNPSCRRRSRLKHLRLGCPFAVTINHVLLGFAVQLACGKEDSGCPCGEKIESGDKLSGKGRQKGPVPSQKLDEDSAYHNVQPCIQRREAAFSKQGHANDLDGVSQNG